MPVNPNEKVVKIKSVDVVLNATIDVGYVDDFDGERNWASTDMQIKNAIAKANTETTELIDIELEDYGREV
ncbi:hypothetical protein K6L05_00080 [Salinicoccus roseus]|uniref:hypothetical protein n=1 Tax=Salinicoccus roseus TaxID=45670 RepID=UPI001CA7850D|nr:hypothetical protein [Salinicoccus roseus]MBY8908182.1 hypothetical protein [Salinicoccus roseus]